MIHLIKKDFLLQKNFYWFALGYTIFIFIVFHNPVFMSLKYIMGATILAYMFIISTFSYEEKNNTDIILNSLPINRQEIIKSKYLMFLCAIMMSVFIVAFVGTIFLFIPFFYDSVMISTTDILVIFCSIVFLTSIHFPLYIRYGSKFMRYFNIVLFMLVFFSPGVIAGYITANPDFILARLFQTVSVNFILTGFLAVLLAIYYLSYKKALVFYENKDF